MDYFSFFLLIVRLFIFINAINFIIIIKRRTWVVINAIVLVYKICIPEMKGLDTN